MNATQALYNAARHYCVDRRTRWSLQYDALEDQLDALGCESDVVVPRSQRDEIYSTLPRYFLLDAILMDIESIDSDALPEYPELEKLLLLAGATAENPRTRDLRSEIEKAAIESERRNFAEAITAPTANSVASIPPLPYRRVLSPKELTSLWERLKSRWGADLDAGLFYPLRDRTEPSLYAFDTAAFEREFPPARLRTLFHGWGISRIYEVRDQGDKNFLLSIDFLDPAYDGTEGYWCAESLDWILYVSHHETTTTGGTLTRAVQSQWQGVERKEWESTTNG